MDWTDCYNDSWKDHIVPEAFSHPAKMAYGLLKRILDHCKDEGWGGVIVDPFGGIGSTGILGAYDGYQVICCELEAKFVSLAKQNFELHRRGFEEFGCPYPVIIQGDSRKLCSVIEESVELIISSPPYEESLSARGGRQMAQMGLGNAKAGRDDKCIDAIGYSNNPKNLGAMKPGKVDMVISSPPYAEAITTRKGPSGLMGGTFRLGRGDMQANKEGYGQTRGQLGAMKPGKVDMVISSPPFCEAQTGGGIAKNGCQNEAHRKGVFDLVGKRSYMPDTHGQTKGNLGNLKAGDVDVILSSPPYEGSIQTNGDGIDWTKIKEGGTNKTLARAAVGTGYGKTKGQLAEEQGPTFWQAAKEILEQCHKILKPGGHAIWVCKDFVRKGQRVPFSDDWQRLCEAVGFKTIHRHKAMLVKEDVKDDLFGGKIVKKTERKSFFRRLAEAKGSPKIDWEDVICMEKD